MMATYIPVPGEATLEVEADQTEGIGQRDIDPIIATGEKTKTAMDPPGEVTEAISMPPSTAAPPQWVQAASQRYQHLLDKTTPYILRRWIGLSVLAFVYILRVLLLQGFYIVSYALGIYILNLLIAFLTPQEDPSVADGEGPTLPTLGSDEFRPFVRRLPEFKFWYSLTKGFCIAFLVTFDDVFDIPVYWPVLLFYWVVLFTVSMRKQIQHMIKYKYVPFSTGKKRYDASRPTADESAPLTVRDE